MVPPERNPSAADRAARGWTPAVVALYVMFAGGCLVTVFWGRVILDEGWYVYAGRLLARGHVPYRDFFFPQAPLAALVFLPVAPFGAYAFLAARAECALMGLAAVALTLRASRRLGGNVALVWTAALLMASYPFCHGLATARSYALVALLTALAFDCLAGDRGDGRGWVWGTAVASLGVAARPSLVPVVVLLWLVGSWRWRGRALWLAAAAILPGSLCALPFVEMGGERFWFGVFDFHGIYYGDSPDLRARLLRDFLWGFVVEQPVAVVLGTSAMVWWGVRASRWRLAPLGPALRLAGVVFLSWLALLAVHGSRPAPFAHHQTMFLPLLVFATALTLSAAAPRGAAGRRLPLAAFGLALAAGYWQHWPGPPRWNGDGAPPRAGEAGALVRREARGRPILAFDPTLAVISGSPMLDGYETGIFSYWPRAREARRLGGRGQSDLRQSLLERTAPVVAFQQADLDFIVRTGGESVLRALGQNYRQVARVPRYGQWMQDLMIFRALGD